MLYFIHIVTDDRTVFDPTGAAFPDLRSAEAEAIQCARDLLIEEMRDGRPLSVDWIAQIADESGTVLAVVPFASVLTTKSPTLSTSREQSGTRRALVA